MAHTPFVFIGYDPREELAYHVLSRSIMARASSPIAIIGLRLDSLPLTRPAEPTQSTEFTYSRFLVPYLSGYQGWSVFMDCDMLCLGDIIELFEMADDTKTVQVVKHDWTPKRHTKFEGHAQVAYPKKCWSSVMLFNNDKCRVLTPDYVDSATGRELHEFGWCDDGDIGALSIEWNWLAGPYTHHPNAKLVHFTEGGPWFPGFEDVPYADAWRKEAYEAMTKQKRSKYLGK